MVPLHKPETKLKPPPAYRCGRGLVKPMGSASSFFAHQVGAGAGDREVSVKRGVRRETSKPFTSGMRVHWTKERDLR